MTNTKKLPSFLENIKTYDDLNDLILKKFEENYFLEYKSGEELVQNKKEVGKDISAFANTEGGVIIYGIKTKKEKGSEIPVKIDGVDTLKCNKETLENLILSQMHPRLNNFKILQIKVNKSRDVFLVQIPESFNCPHMFMGQSKNSFRYFKRYNFQSVPMNDSEVRACLNKIEKTKITISHAFTAQETKNGGKRYADLNIWLSVKGGRLLKYPHIFILIPNELNPQIVSNVIKDSTESEGVTKFINKTEDRIYPKIKRRIGTIKINSSIPKKEYNIIVAVVAENYPLEGVDIPILF